MRATLILPIAVVALTLLLVAFDAGQSRSQTQMQDAGAWSAPTPTIGEAWYSAPCVEDEPCWDCETMGNLICGPAYELGYGHGYEDARNGESFGGDK